MVFVSRPECPDVSLIRRGRISVGVLWGWGARGPGRWQFGDEQRDAALGALHVLAPDVIRNAQHGATSQTRAK